MRATYVRCSFDLETARCRRPQRVVPEQGCMEFISSGVHAATYGGIPPLSVLTAQLFFFAGDRGPANRPACGQHRLRRRGKPTFKSGLEQEAPWEEDRA